ncbi:hypothetical protein Cni_G10878 [Canna indica]|uniref:Membrane-associated kinase regulator 2 n=1 Tax=Canna indica TaxID=4628 RepID=A0AAQ3Q8Z6_9LILI|nr:hypothetical protein Cni_G10878 [Canna indica]
MESFSLLKYWRGGGGGATVAAAIRSSTPAPSSATTVAAAVIRPSSATTDDGGGDDDEGPFFDLEFAALPADDGSSGESQGEVDEGEFNFELSSVGSGGAGGGGGGAGEGIRAEGFTPSDDLFFKGKLVPLDSSSIVIAASDSDNKPHFPAVSLLKSATKFRVFLPGLRKPKTTSAESNGAPVAVMATGSPKPPPQQQQQQSRFFVKFKVDEVPIVSLFTRDNSSRNSSTNRASKPPTEETTATTTAAAVEAEEKRFAREVLQKYRNMIKPLYVRASRKHGEKPKLPAEPAPPKAAAGPGEGEPGEAAPALGPAASASGNKSLPAGLRVVGKRLGKSWSASAAVAAVPSPPPQRRDDSLLEQQDGIQSAIAHCKRSFTAPEKGTRPTTF